MNLHCNCLPTLLKALADSHPDREVWLNSYQEEINRIWSMNTYQKITLGEYRVLREKVAPKAIPTMCVLTIKKDENLLPLPAKSWIVVLGNHKDRIWSKSDHFAPVLCQDSLCFLVSCTVQKRCPLHQGDCKNVYWQGVLPPDEITIVCPPQGAPDVKPDEYWLLQCTLYTVCASAQDTGTTRSMQSFVPLGCAHHWRTHVCTQDSFRTCHILPAYLQPPLSLWDCMLMILFTSWRTPQWKPCSVAC